MDNDISQKQRVVIINTIIKEEKIRDSMLDTVIELQTLIKMRDDKAMELRKLIGRFGALK